MQTRFRDGTVLVIGSCARDAELEYVGADCKRVCRVGLAVGRRPAPGGGKADTVWCNVQAWHDLAAVLSAAKKGDPVLVAGKLKTRTYQDREYTDLVAEFVSVCSVSAAAALRPAQGRGSAGPGVNPPGSGFDFSDGADDGELPF